jgi:hypothetical protein
MPFPEGLAEFAFEDFAGTAHRQRVSANVYTAGAFVTSDVLATVLQQFIGR